MGAFLFNSNQRVSLFHFSPASKEKRSRRHNCSVGEIGHVVCEMIPLLAGCSCNFLNTLPTDALMADSTTTEENMTWELPEEKAP